MGLDMHLLKVTHVGEFRDWAKSEIFRDDVSGVFGIDPAKVAFIVEEVMYWRNAPTINNWFEENVGAECNKRVRVELSDIQNLLKEVEFAISNNDGVDIFETKDALENILAQKDTPLVHYEYQADY